MSLFDAEDAVDPGLVPTLSLDGGLAMPAIGLGTFGSDRYAPDEIGAAVLGALEVGYRHIDCAAVYGNEREVGRALADGGLPRSALWITSKLWNDAHDDVEAACRASLAALGLAYLDLYLVHWPYPNSHEPGVDVRARDAGARPYDPDRYLRTWRAMERLVEQGLTRAIGTSNMSAGKLRGLLAHASIRPAANQLELHPHLAQPGLVEFLRAERIAPVAFCPLGSPRRPERDRTPEDLADMEHPALRRVAEEAGLSPAGACIRWALQRGTGAVPFSVKRAQYLDTLRAAVAPPLSEAQMAELDGLDRGCRLIKGQVFLWPGAPGWQALWSD